MAAPTIKGAAASAYAGYTFGDLYEDALNERGLSADSASTEFTVATAAQIAKTKRFIKDGLAYLHQQRELWFPQAEADVTAEAAGGVYSAIPVPVDCGKIEALVIGNVKLIPLTLDEYLANLVPTAEGGGLQVVENDTDPAFYRLAVTSPASAAAVPALHAIVLPEQDTVFTARFFYRVNGQALSGATDTIYLHLVMQPLLVQYVSYRWALDDGNVARADALWGHLMARLEEVSFQAPDVNVLPVVHNTYPSETASRR